LKGEQIPLGARILGLAVEYDEEFVKATGHMPTHVFQEMFFEKAQGQHDPRLLELFRAIVLAVPHREPAPGRLD
jgi:response regulator RpfG family c-di-GMP phosphodiesterase